MNTNIKVPDGKKGVWEVSTFTVTEKDADAYNVRASFSFTDRGLYIKAGTYKRLTRDGHVIMSNTPAEMQDLYPLRSRLRGDIMIHGLGLGCVVQMFLDSKETKSVTVVELDKDVIDLVGPTYTKDSRVTIINADAYSYTPPKGSYYQVTWSDVWDNVESANLDGMKRLTCKYGRICDWHGCWKRERCEYMRTKERKWKREMELWDYAKRRVRERALATTN